MCSPIPQLNYPVLSVSTSPPPHFSRRSRMANSQNQYPATYPHSNPPIAPSDFSTGPHENQQAIGDSYRDAIHITGSHLPDNVNGPSFHGGTFITAQNVNHIERLERLERREGVTGIDILHGAVALEALHDSADSFPQPRCHPETRTKMLDDLYKWAICNDSVRSIRWLHGPAGAGKSAMMQNLCLKLQDAGLLGGAFFFKRGHPTRGNGKALFATLAYQLALNNPKLKHWISKTVENDASVVGRHMEVQLYKLIIEPYQSARGCPPPILLVDGLDECDTHGTQVEILRLVADAVRQHPYPFRLLIASRPEVHIRDAFKRPSFDAILTYVNIEQSFTDIRKYLHNEFARIHREHRDTMGRVPTPWPSPEILDQLVEKSSGYFIYASTVIKFVDDEYARPTERLAVIQILIPSDSDPPFEILDKLYIQILSGVPARFRSKLGDILYCVISEWDLDLTPLQIDWLLELKPGDTQLILRGLHSVLKTDSTGRISMYHASFLEFVQDPRRSSNFCIELDNRMNVARAVFSALSNEEHWLGHVDNPLVPLGMVADETS
ncbi:hypothetical protein B0H13DRAFT_2302797 [Mycena leptocephala]|nr:hypothetical protein B0H13DRAFT_2302797 [Mycena leptocephala]